MDVAALDFGMRGEDFPGSIEPAMPNGDINELGTGVLGRGLVFGHNSLIIARARSRRSVRLRRVETHPNDKYRTAEDVS